MLSKSVEFLFRIYRNIFSAAVHQLAGAGAGCRFEPTCSEYSHQAFRQHSPGKAAILSVSRILRCNPFFRGGWDPIPAPKHR